MQRQFLSGHEVVWFDPDWLRDPPEQIFSPGYWLDTGRVSGQAQGRGTTWFIRTGQGEAALRHYHRGGLFGKLVRDCYLFRGWEQTRSAQELQLLQWLHDAGVSVPKPLAARAVRHGLCYRADLITARIANARDLAGILTGQPLQSDDYQRIGAEIARLHRAGVNHTDLNIHNILIDADQRVWLIDFDKCHRQNGHDWQQGNLDRLLRSFHKERLKRAIMWQDDDFRALLAGYHSTLSQPG